MRTDSTTLQRRGADAARATAAEMYGDDYVADAPRRYDSKVKQRPGGPRGDPPGGRVVPLDRGGGRAARATSARLYELIWKRTIACQMVDARLTQDRVRLDGTLAGRRRRERRSRPAWRATGQRIVFPGFRRAYVEGSDDPEAELADQERLLPELAEGQAVPVVDALARSHDDQAARPLQRGDPDAAARGPGHRPAVDLRVA